VLTRESLLSMVREDGIRMALSRCPVIRFPYSEERGGIKRFGEERGDLDGRKTGRGQALGKASSISPWPWSFL
jgi:hypothetical protein